MRYVVVGAGAVGGAIGGHLARAGRDVVLIARGPHLAALQDAGLDLRTPGGREVLRLPAVASVAEVDWRDGDVVLLTVKGQHHRRAAGRARRARRPGTRPSCAPRTAWPTSGGRCDASPTSTACA